GRTFKESLQKALRGLETGRFGISCDRHDRWGRSDQPSRGEIEQRLSTPNAERIWYIRYALKDGMTIEDIHQRTRIDLWFLDQIKEIIEVEDELKACRIVDRADDRLWLKAKQHGYADRQLAH